MAMLELRATPLDDNMPSPAKLLGNRRYKTTLPTITRASYNSEAVWQSLLKRQEYAGYDAHAKELPQLLPQQPVWLQKAPNTSHWQEEEHLYKVSTRCKYPAWALNRIKHKSKAPTQHNNKRVTNNSGSNTT